MTEGFAMASNRLPADPLLRDFALEWSLSLDAAGRSPATVRSYLGALSALSDWLTSHHLPTDPAEFTTSSLERFYAEMRTRLAPASVSIRWRSLRVFLQWCEEREYIPAGRSPMRRMKAPRVPVKVVPVLTLSEAARLLAAAEGRDFADLRDRAIIRLLLDSGMRRGEVSRLDVADVRVDLGTVLIREPKNRRDRIAPLGVKARTEMRRYLRARAAYIGRSRGSTGRTASAGALFVGKRGRITPDGVYQVVEARARKAGLDYEKAVHGLRHTFAHHALANGASEIDVMTVAGWSSSSLLTRYGAAGRTERALASHARWSVGDRI